MFQKSHLWTGACKNRRQTSRSLFKLYIVLSHRLIFYTETRNQVGKGLVSRASAHYQSSLTFDILMELSGYIVPKKARANSWCERKETSVTDFTASLVFIKKSLKNHFSFQICGFSMHCLQTQTNISSFSLSLKETSVWGKGRMTGRLWRRGWGFLFFGVGRSGMSLPWK